MVKSTTKKTPKQSTLEKEAAFKLAFVISDFKKQKEAMKTIRLANMNYMNELLVIDHAFSVLNITFVYPSNISRLNRS